MIRRIRNWFSSLIVALYDQQDNERLAQEASVLADLSSANAEADYYRARMANPTPDRNADAAAIAGIKSAIPDDAEDR